MKKYRIIRQISNGIPYTVEEFDNFHKCYMYFLKMIKEENLKVKQFKSSGFYILNDFYKNEYNLNQNTIKISIEKKKGKGYSILRLQDI